MRELALAGLIAVAAGLGSYYAIGDFGWFSRANLGVGAAALMIAAARGAVRVRGLGGAGGRRLLLPRLAGLLAVLAAAVVAERLAAGAQLRFDWTVEQRFQLAPATLDALERLTGPGAADGDAQVAATLYYDRGDPRFRGTRLLLDSFAATGRVAVRERILDDAIEDVDRFGITSSNTVLLEHEVRWQLVERPTEGSLWEGLERLDRSRDERVVYITRGQGEGDPTRADDAGYAGLAVAMQTEGLQVRELVLAAAEAVPEDAAALVIPAPQRPLREQSLALLRAHLRRGGGLVVFLDPGVETGLETLLTEYGFALPDGVVVDAASGPVEGLAPGVAPIAYAYGDHPIVRSLDGNRMTFFPGVRPVELGRKPEPRDDLEIAVWSSPRSWLSPDVAAAERGARPERPETLRLRRFGLVALGRYPRGEDDVREARIAVFGDSDLASNRHLRTLYNLDLVMNTVQWTTARDPAITVRAKFLGLDQQPLTLQQSLTMFYGLGLLLPELLLIAAAVVWSRRRGA